MAAAATVSGSCDGRSLGRTRRHFRLNEIRLNAGKVSESSSFNRASEGRIAEDGAGNELGSGMKKERVNSPERSEEQKLQLRSWVQSTE